MDDTAKLLEQIQQVARNAADIDITDASWGNAGLGDLVIDLLERSARALAAIGAPGAQAWSSMAWSNTDPPVVLARALEVTRRRLSAAVREGRTEDRAPNQEPHTETIAAPLEDVAVAAG